MEGGAAHGYRQCLQVALAALMGESGFEKCDRMAMETLAEMTVAFMTEVGRSGKAFCELACRSEPLGADVLLALTEMGAVGGSNPQAFGVKGLKDYALRPGRKTVGVPTVALNTKQPSMLHTGERKKDGRGKVPDYLPEYPDSHTYIRTPTHRQPEHDYESVREKAASQKRDVERALTRFIAKTCGKTHSLFNTDDTNLYPLISCDPKATRATATSLAQASQLFHTANPHQNPFGSAQDASALDNLPPLPPYVSALMFRDQLFEEDEREFLPKKKAKEEDEEEEEAGDEEDKSESQQPDSDSDEKKDKIKVEDPKPSGHMDNPFLRPTRTPRNVIVGATAPSQRRML